jgi:hypothetical protein
MCTVDKPRMLTSAPLDLVNQSGSFRRSTRGPPAPPAREPPALAWPSPQVIGHGRGRAARTPPHSLESPRRCSRRCARGHARQSRPTLLVEPPGQPLLDLVLGQDSPCLDVFAAALDALQDVEVVLDVLERGSLGEAVEDPSDILLCGGGHRLGGYRGFGGWKWRAKPGTSPGEVPESPLIPAYPRTLRGLGGGRTGAKSPANHALIAPRRSPVRVRLAPPTCR